MSACDLAFLGIFIDSRKKAVTGLSEQSGKPSGGCCVKRTVSCCVFSKVLINLGFKKPPIMLSDINAK